MTEVERRKICSDAIENAKNNFFCLKYEMAVIIQNSLDAESKANSDGMNRELYNKIFMPLNGLKIIVLPNDYYRKTDRELNPKYDDVKFDGIKFKIDGESYSVFEKNGPLVLINNFEGLKEDNDFKILMAARNTLIDSVLSEWDYAHNKEKDNKNNEYVDMEYLALDEHGEVFGPDTFYRGDYCLPDVTRTVIIRKIIYTPKEGITNSKYDVMENARLLAFNSVNYQIIDLFNLSLNYSIENIRKISNDNYNYPINIEFPSVDELEKYMSYLHTRYILCDLQADNGRYAKILR